MAAGLGFKDFVTGEVLTAADVDGYLMQGIWVFASAAARDAAVTSPQEGNFAFLKDTNTTTYYTGSAWTNLDTTGMVNPMTTTGDIVYSSSGSTPARLGIGSTGNVLTVSGGLPVWSAPAGGGKVLQVLQATYSTSFSTTSTSYSDTGLSLSITPSSATSKVLIMINQTLRATGSSDTSVGAALRILRDSTTIYEPAPNRYQMHYVEFSQANSPALDNLAAMVYLDSPATTSATTYKTQLATYQSGESSSTSAASSISVITLFEIGA